MPLKKAHVAVTLLFRMRKCVKKMDASVYLRGGIVYLRLTCGSEPQPYLGTIGKMNLGQDRPSWCRVFPGEVSQTSAAGGMKTGTTPRR